MNRARIAIIGGGLSGLYAALLLEKRGIQDYVLLEARNRFGGRVLSAGISDECGTSTSAFDLGPSWFWPAYQPQLDQLVTSLGLHRFDQPEQGNTLVERSAGTPPVEILGYSPVPASVRIEGGMSALIDSIKAQLKSNRLLTDRRVSKLYLGDCLVHLESLDSDGCPETWAVDQALIALPPRLFTQTIECSPSLPANLVRQWQLTPTWMAPHAKYVAVYDLAFWRDQGLSGQARSAVGPLVEIHDASSCFGYAALFGFLGVDATTRRQVTEDQLKALCCDQLVRLFGKQAAKPKATFLKDWAQDPLTATQADWQASSHHSQAPSPFADRGPWFRRLIGIGSEWSPQYPGYLAGAIDAALQGISSVAID